MYNEDRGEFMESYSVIVLLFGILVLLLLVLLYFVNRIMQYKTRIDNSFLAVKESLDERIKIIEIMIDFLKDNLEHEKSYQKKLKNTKEVILSIKNNREGINLIKKTEKDVLSFVKLENTYKNLVKNKDFLKIREELLNNKERLIYALDSYDKGVIDYNNYKAIKVVYWLSKLCRLPEYDCYNK